MLNNTPGKGSVWRASTPRVDIYRAIMDAGNWRLDGMVITKQLPPAGVYRVTNTYYGEFSLL